MEKEGSRLKDAKAPRIAPDTRRNVEKRGGKE